MDDPRNTSSAALLATLAGGWGLLAVIGGVLTLFSQPMLALIAVSSVGLYCSVKGFGNGCEMFLAMTVSIILGSLIIPITSLAWVAPMLPGGFMVSVVLGDMIRN